MTPSKSVWIVLAGRGLSSEQLGRGFAVDLDEAKAKVNEHVDRLRRERRTDWIGLVLNLDGPTLMSPHAPILGWERVYFVDGRD